MVDSGSILVTGAAGQLGAVGRTVTGLLLDRGLPVRAMVRREDDRAAALRAAGAESTSACPCPPRIWRRP
jgi:NAD(P)H dehydrogenase (quinone)